MRTRGGLSQQRLQQLPHPLLTGPRKKYSECPNMGSARPAYGGGLMGGRPAAALLSGAPPAVAMTRTMLCAAPEAASRAARDSGVVSSSSRVASRNRLG